MSAEAKSLQPKARSTGEEWRVAEDPIVIGKDILELLSSSMYVDAMSIYREYVQNAADAIDQRASRSRSPGRVHIWIDPSERSVKIRDNGTGVRHAEFNSRLINLGASAKRGTTARGFRGVGRLAGLGYCQELIFRSQADDELSISEMRWDCRRLRSLLRAAEHDKDIISVFRDVVTVRTVMATKHDHFFEVELKGVVRHRNDELLNAEAVRNYLSQVAPVPFSPNFSHGTAIADMLVARGLPNAVDVRMNDEPDPVYRPHRDLIELDGATIALRSVELHELPSVDGDTAAVAWIAHHEYAGAIPNAALVKGLRVRSGNIQVGDHAMFEELFAETRFNAWTIGEVHVFDRRLVPNGRRDHFEQGVHFENLQNHLAPIAREVSRQCRTASVARKWIKIFELHKLNALERAKVVSRGGISKHVASLQANAARTSLKAMHRVVEQNHLGDDERSTLSAEAARVEGRVTRMIKDAEGERNPLSHFRPEVRRAYENVISLIYENLTSRAAAGVLVEKILSKIEADASKNHTVKRKPPKRK